MKYLNVSVYNEGEYTLEDDERYLEHILSGRIVDEYDMSYEKPKWFELPTSYRIVFVEENEMQEERTFMIMFEGDVESIKWLLSIDCDFIRQEELWSM